MSEPIFYAVGYAFIFNEKNEILLQRRSKNCSYMPNTRSVPSGHLEKKEGIKAAMTRELNEELGIIVEAENLEIITNTYFYNEFTDREYFGYYIIVKKYIGEIKVMEPDKCDGFRYCSMDELPYDNMPPEVAFSLRNYLKGVKFDEFFYKIN